MFSDLTHIFQPPEPWRHRTALVYHLRWTTGRILLSSSFPLQHKLVLGLLTKILLLKGCRPGNASRRSSSGRRKEGKKARGPRTVDDGASRRQRAGRSLEGPAGRRLPERRRHRDGQARVGAGGGSAPAAEMRASHRRTGRTLRIRPPTPRAAQTAQGAAATRPPAAPSPVPGGQASEARLATGRSATRQRAAAVRRRRTAADGRRLLGGSRWGLRVRLPGARAPPPAAPRPAPDRRGPGCSLLRGPRPRLFSDFAQTVRPSPSKSASRPPRPRESLASSRAARASARALSRSR